MTDKRPLTTGGLLVGGQACQASPARAPTLRPLVDTQRTLGIASARLTQSKVSLTGALHPFHRRAPAGIELLARLVLHHGAEDAVALPVLRHFIG